MKPQLKHLSQVVLILILGLTVAVAGAQAGGSPRLRVVHASPNAPNADIYADGNLLFPNLFYRGITNYALLSPGNHTLKVLPAGTNRDTPGVIEATLPFVDGKDYTLVALGRVEGLEARQLEDDNALPEPGKARVRIVHASVDAPALDICRAGSNDCPVTNLTFKNGSGYITLDGGMYNLDVRQTGTSNVLLNVPNLRFDSGGVYSAFVMGLIQGEPKLQLIPSLDAGQPPPYPPTTGAFLSPAALTLVVTVGLALAGGIWLVRRHVSGV